MATARQYNGQTLITLTKADWRILRLVAAGLSNPQIGTRLLLSHKTVEHMLGSSDTRGIYRKLSVKNRPQAVVWYRDLMISYHLLLPIGPEILKWANMMRLWGFPDISLVGVPHLIDLLRREITGRVVALDYARPLLKNLAYLLLEHLVAHYETAEPGSLSMITTTIAEEIHEIAEALNDRELFGLVDYAWGMTGYILGEYDQALEAFDRALGKITEPDYQLLALRTMALSLAYDQQQDEFLKVEQRAQRLLKLKQVENLSLICMVWEGLGRGRGLLELPGVAEGLEEGWRVYDRLAAGRPPLPLRYTQLARSGLEVMRVSPGLDRDMARQRGQRALDFAKRHGYRRYQRRLEALLGEN